MASQRSKRGYVVGSPEDEIKILEDMSPTSKVQHHNKQLLTEMRTQNFDVIRFATYRTACKLRFIQKKTSLSVVDIWNIIEAFRENGLNTLEPESELNSSRVESVLDSIYVHLNKRLPLSQQVDSNQCVQMLLNWLVGAFDSVGRGKIKVFSLKVALSHMCAGKLVDKLRYIFTQISDSSGCLIRSRFIDYLKDLLALPTAVFEGPSFGYNDTACRSCFDNRTQINVNDFLNALMADPGPQCLMWLPILNKMAHVENVFHPVQCEGCHRESFMGFRYKCQRCYNYQLCQDCFWRGRTSGNHGNEHEMKEYTTYKSPAKQIGHALKKSLKCVPKSNAHVPRFPNTPEKKLDLSYIINLPFEEILELLKPPTPVPVRNGYHESSIVTSHSPDVLSIDSGNSPQRQWKQSSEVSNVYHESSIVTSHSPDVLSIDSGNSPQSPSKLTESLNSMCIDDEHRLIARYAARLAADTKNAARSPTEINFSLDTNKAQRELIIQLESKNREIMREIQRLRAEQEAHAKSTADAQYNPTLLAELRLLRQRKDELESRMQTLQESRKELMVQLEGLMKLLKTNPTSPRSTLNGSTRSHVSQSQSFAGPITIRSQSMSDSPGNMPTSPGMESSTLSGVGGEVQEAFSQPSSADNVRLLRNDLLCAADSVTSAMSSLVKELNSEQSCSDDEDDNGEAEANVEMADAYVTKTQEDMDNWQQEVLKRLDQEQDFIAQLRKRRQHSNSSSIIQSDNENDSSIPMDMTSSYVKTDDSSVVTDNDSCTKSDGDDEDDSELYDNHPKELPNRMNSSTFSTDEESFLQSDAESYIRTDEEDNDNDWEESMKRWANR
ncbi:Dystrobrevin-1,Dystrobrevin alpha,Dystrobrevin beta [Mytilus coruscus]|uniref:Dystrobrevin-1,Dystrobrevin alpha,Dystrobrevin beta n=1 Tax=Mytilus coruscus TaxID=42192 RepID=A0A6J8B1P2_MYTCO|nr:Dystrobrevin-1,Dystrobrevin alpha,Dystrobrevin beta [Mytilus coruscus]